MYLAPNLIIREKTGNFGIVVGPKTNILGCCVSLADTFNDICNSLSSINSGDTASFN